MNNKELMLSEQCYMLSGNELTEQFKKSRRLTRQINQTTEEETKQRQQLFKALFKEIGENFLIETPFRCDYGNNITIGNNFFANYDCIFIDVCDINIGDHVFLGPRVCIFTAAHPIDAKVRNTTLEYGKKVNIGNDVWIGGNVTINPGVTIGNDVVIGSGSVVTKDIPDHCIAVGNPCKVLRAITQADRIYWQQELDKYNQLMDKSLSILPIEN